MFFYSVFSIKKRFLVPRAFITFTAYRAGIRT